MSEILEYIFSYGVIPVFIAAGIIIILRLTKKQQNIQEKQQKDNAEQAERMAKIFESLLQIRQNMEPHSPQIEEENHKINLLIDSQIQELLSQTNSNRVSCFLFHNGGKDIVGRSFQKMSMTHEVVDSTTVPVMSSYQNVPRMMFPTMIEKLITEGKYYIDNIEDIKTTAATSYQAFYARGTKAAYIQAIKTSDNILMGFVCVEFHNQEERDLSTLQYHLINKAMKISGALEINNEIVRRGGKT